MINVGSQLNLLPVDFNDHRLTLSTGWVRQPSIALTINAGRHNMYPRLRFWKKAVEWYYWPGGGRSSIIFYRTRWDALMAYLDEK